VNNNPTDSNNRSRSLSSNSEYTQTQSQHSLYTACKQQIEQNFNSQMCQNICTCDTNLFTVFSFFFCLCLPAVDRLLEVSQRQHIQLPISATNHNFNICLSV